MPSIVIPAQKLKWEQGLDSPNRGDGRWICSIAEMLQDQGWDIDILCNLDVSDRGVNFVSSPSQERYDAAFYLYKLSDDELLDADQHWLGVFDKNSAPPTSPFKMVTPYRSYPNYYRLPLAYRKQFEFPNYDKKSIIWGVKDPFDNRDLAEEWLEALYALTTLGYSVTIMNADHFDHWNYKFKPAGNITFLPSNTRQNVIDSYIRKSSILITLTNISSAHRAVPLGVVPLPLNNVLDFYCEDTINLIRSDLGEMKTSNIVSYLMKLLNDKNYYEKLCYEMQDKCGIADKWTAERDIHTLCGF